MSKQGRKIFPPIDDLQKKVKIYEADLLDAKSKLKEANKTAEQLILKAQEKENDLVELRLKHNRLLKGIEEYQKMKELSVEREKQIQEQQKEFEKAETQNHEVRSLQREKANFEQKIRELTTALQDKDLQTEALVKHRERIENLSKECEKQRQTREKSEHEMTELEQVVQKKTNEMEALNARLEEFSKKCSALHRDKEEAHLKISALTDALYYKNMEFESLTNQLERIKDLSKQLTNGKRDKENAEKQIDSLSKTLFHKEIELQSVQNELARSEKNVSILLKDIKDFQASERLADEKLQVLQSENTSLKSALSKATNEIDDFLKKGTSLQKYKTDTEHKTSTLINALKEKETEIETLSKQLARAEENVSTLSQDIVDIQASKHLVAEKKLQSLQTKNASLKSALSKATDEIEDLLNKGTNLQKYKTDAEHKTSTLMSALKEKETEIEALREQLARIEDLLNKGTNLQKHKTDAEHKTSTLMNALKEKETEIEALREQLARAEEKVSTLSQDIVDIQASKRLVAEVKLQNLQTENVSLKSALSKATNEIEDLLNKGTNLQKYKTDAEHKTSTLMNVLEEKETEIEALREQLARAEKNVSILSQDITDIQASKREVAEEKLQDLQTENASLKSALSKTTNEIEDLLKKGTNLQKYKTDAEHKTSTLMNALKEKEFEIEALREQLARAEKNVSILSQNITDIQASKRQVVEEKLQDLQTENASLKSALSKATNEIEYFLNKGTNLQKYKTDAEHKISMLMNAVKEKETEIEALGEQMNELSHKYKYLQKDKENAERTINNLSKTVQQRNKEIDSLVETLENYDQIRHDSNEAKRERDHDFKRLTSVAEGNGKRDSKGLM